MLHNSLIEVFAPEVLVACCGKHTEDAALNLEERDVQRTAAQVIHKQRLVPTFLQPICHSSSCRLANKPQDIQTSNCCSSLSSLPLSLIEVGWNCYHGVLNFLLQVLLSSLLQLSQHHGRDLLWLE
mmetsp:Transcript_34819/g.81298  ORF Transcript_34819/g.81298 Transcript_34819/m.81298 type:complete len:126 (-) Transcript_34819:516-893(-)